MESMLSKNAVASVQVLEHGMDFYYVIFINSEISPIQKSDFTIKLLKFNKFAV